MQTPFLSFVEDRWNLLHKTSICRTSPSVARRPSSDQLLIEIETREAKARISARESLRTLDITVHRFKDEKSLSDGGCANDAEADRRLRSLLIDLSASPFA
jgi:hypothetical protein